MILYDSVTSSLISTWTSASSTARRVGEKAKTSSKQTQSQAQTNKKVSDTEREKLAQTIIRNKFFQTDIYYAPDPGGPQNYTLMVLAINLDGKSHAVIWADTSENVPTGLSSIVEGIEEIASK